MIIWGRELIMNGTLRKTCVTVEFEEFFDTEVFINSASGSVSVTFVGKMLKTILTNAHLLEAFFVFLSNQEEAAGIGRDYVALLEPFSEHVCYRGAIA